MRYYLGSTSWIVIRLFTRYYYLTKYYLTAYQSMSLTYYYKGMLLHKLPICFIEVVAPTDILGVCLIYKKQFQLSIFSRRKDQYCTSSCEAVRLTTN